MNMVLLMKNSTLSLLFSLLLLLTGCHEEGVGDEIKFATSADYPPFEYHEQGEIKGFDIDLAHMIAHELGKKAVIEDMQFSSILPALLDKRVNAAISTLTITEERQKSFDFSDPYHFASMAVVFKATSPITDKSQLAGKKIGCQLGTTMEIWLKKYVPDAEIVSLNNNNLAIESLKAGHVDAVLMDGIQASAFSKNNAGLSSTIIAQSDDGYGIAFIKSSPLKDKVNHALASLKAKGEIKKLEEKWLGN